MSLFKKIFNSRKGIESPLIKIHQDISNYKAIGLESQIYPFLVGKQSEQNSTSDINFFGSQPSNVNSSGFEISTPQYDHYIIGKDGKRKYPELEQYKSILITFSILSLAGVLFDSTIGEHLRKRGSAIEDLILPIMFSMILVNSIFGLLCSCKSWAHAFKKHLEMTKVQLIIGGVVLSGYLIAGIFDSSNVSGKIEMIAGLTLVLILNFILLRAGQRKERFLSKQNYSKGYDACAV